MRKRSHSLIVCSLVVVLCLVLSGSRASASPLLATPVGTAFTYQGQLKDGSGNPITKTCDLQFSLYDAVTGGSLVGAPNPNTVTGVTVTNGYFTVSLDFGAGAFSGDARWLEVAVRCPAGSGSYTTLSPRQALTPAPYSLYAAKAGHAANVVVVAKSGGDFTSIQAAVNSISDASATKPYLVYVAPGVYSEQVEMRPYVDIMGAGEDATIITYASNISACDGTVIGASNAELRLLTVENTGGSAGAIGISNCSQSPRIADVNVTISVAIGSNIGVFNNAAAPTMANVSIQVSGNWSTNYGLYDNNGSSPTLTNSTVAASGGSCAYGVWNNSSAITIQNSSVSGSGATTNDGIHNVAGSGSVTVTVNGSQITGSTSTIYGDTGSCTVLYTCTNKIGGSMLAGSGVQGNGSYACAASYNGSYGALNASCH